MKANELKKGQYENLIQWFVEVDRGLHAISVRLDSIESQLLRITSLLAGAESSSPKAPPPNSKNLDHFVMAAAEAAVQHHLARALLALSQVLTEKKRA